jgi:hypothetical protein
VFQALSFSGRFNVSLRTAPTVSTSTNSDMPRLSIA